MKNTAASLVARLNREQQENGLVVLSIPRNAEHYFRKAYRDRERWLRSHNSPWKIPR